MELIQLFLDPFAGPAGMNLVAIGTYTAAIGLGVVAWLER